MDGVGEPEKSLGTGKDYSTLFSPHPHIAFSSQVCGSLPAFPAEQINSHTHQG